MKPVNEHDCEEFTEEKLATPEAPYHYTGSGLPNVYLTGIRYFVCSKCGVQAADIPALRELLRELARTLVEKLSPLHGPEIRFLRKRLNKKAIDFGAMIGVTPEQVSRWENASNPPEKSADRLIRVAYCALSGDKQLLREKVEKSFEQWITSIQGEGRDEIILARRMRNKQWRIQVELQAA